MTLTAGADYPEYTTGIVLLTQQTHARKKERTRFRLYSAKHALIQRPELLNRIGDNFVVFDFIREEAAEEILQLKLNAIVDKG